MGVGIVFVGSKFVYNNPFKEYIFRHVEKIGVKIIGVNYLKEKDSALFLEIEKFFESYSKIVIVTTSQTFGVVSKIIATILEDSLVVKEEKLIPSKASSSLQNSYLIQIHDCLVNVIEANTNQKLPPLLLPSSQQYVMQIFDEEESTLEVLLEPLSQTYEVKIEYNTLIPGWIELYILEKKYGNANGFCEAVKKLIPQKALITSNIMEYIIQVLSKHGLKITFAESCTGGLLSYFLTKNNGSSSIFDGSLITYANHIKENWLAVTQENIKQYGAVSSIVVEEMSEGAIGVSEADFAISVSGIAGDGGGSEEKPVGTVFLNVRSYDNNTTLQLQLQGDRNYIQYQSVLFGIKTLLTENKKLFF